MDPTDKLIEAFTKKKREQRKQEQEKRWGYFLVNVYQPSPKWIKYLLMIQIRIYNRYFKAKEIEQ